MQGSLLWKRKVLSNGLTVLLFPRSSGMTTQLAVTIRYGSNADSEDKSGTAHFLEHMIAGGSPERIDFSRNIERLGGCVDFFTTHDYTMAVADVVSEKADRASKILSKLLFDSCFVKENFELERKIILHEIAEASDNPWTQMDEMLTKCLFRMHPVRRPVSGYRKTVSNLSLKDIEETHKAYYASHNIILTIAGQFSEGQVENVLQNFSDPAENGKNVSKGIDCPENSQPRKEMATMKSGLSQAYLSIGARTVSGKHPDIPALELINTIIGGGASSRLFIEMREKRALAYNIQSCQECGLDYGYFHIDCAVKNKNLSQTSNLILEELEKIRNKKVPEAELNKARDMIIGAIYREFDSPTNLPETLASMEMLFNNENALTDYIQKIKIITQKDITETANKHLQENNYSIVTLTPKP